MAMHNASSDGEDFGELCNCKMGNVTYLLQLCKSPTAHYANWDNCDPNLEKKTGTDMKKRFLRLKCRDRGGGGSLLSIYQTNYDYCPGGL